MTLIKAIPLTALLFGLIVFSSCNDNDEEEKRGSVQAGSAQTEKQKPGQKPDVDEDEEGEEGPATPAAVAAEKPASQQSSGKQFAYSFDDDTPGQMPPKFHSAKAGRGASERWAVEADPTAPSKP